MSALKSLRTHLADNGGDENVSKMIWIVIVFVVGAILLGLIVAVFGGTISNWWNNVTSGWFNNNTQNKATPKLS